jgi:hypothetical protein
MNENLLRSDHVPADDAEMLDVLAEFLSIYANRDNWREEPAGEAPHHLRRGKMLAFDPSNVVDGYRFAEEALEALRRYVTTEGTRPMSKDLPAALREVGEAAAEVFGAAAGDVARRLDDGTSPVTFGTALGPRPVVTCLSRDRFEERPDGPAFSEFNRQRMEWIGGDKPFQLIEDWHIVVVYRFRKGWYRTELIFHAGMCHDGSSVPLTLGGLLRINWRDVFSAGTGHDGGYQAGIFSRAEWDVIWRVIATNGTKRRTPRWKGWVGWLGLWAGGWPAWNNYRRQELGR